MYSKGNVLLHIILYLINFSKTKEATIIILDTQNAKFTIIFLFSDLLLKIQEIKNIIPKIPVVVYESPAYREYIVDKVTIKSKIY